MKNGKVNIISAPEAMRIYKQQSWKPPYENYSHSLMPTNVDIVDSVSGVQDSYAQKISNKINLIDAKVDLDSNLENTNSFKIEDFEKHLCLKSLANIDFNAKLTKHILTSFYCKDFMIENLKAITNCKLGNCSVILC